MAQIIHILAGKANPNTLNGVNKVVDALATEQVKLGIDTIVVGVAENTIERHNPIYKYKLFKKNTFVFSYPHSLLLFLLCNSDSETRFHFHSVFIPWYLPLIKDLIKEKRNHIYFTPHGGLVQEGMKGPIKKTYFHLFEKNIIKKVEAVHIIGYQTENNKYITSNARKIINIPNGFGCQNVPSFSVPNEYVIGCLGRLDKYHKGLDLLIPAFADYKRRGGKSILKLAGDGKDKSFLENLIKKEKMQDSIIMVGVVYDNAKWNFLGSCSAHISPSRFDVLPTACLEAAFAGCVQLTDINTNMGKYVETWNAGNVINKLTIENITSQLFWMDDVFEDKKKFFEMREAARQMIIKELNWEVISKKIVKDLYGLSY